MKDNLCSNKNVYMLTCQKSGHIFGQVNMYVANWITNLLIIFLERLILCLFFIIKILLNYFLNRQFNLKVKLYILL